MDNNNWDQHIDGDNYRNLPLFLPLQHTHSQRILQLFVQLLLAIEHVHSLNILHRDLKTQNVLMNRKRTVLKIGDFGISKVLSSKITSAHTVRV